jgi:hypothetical protein
MRKLIPFILGCFWVAHNEPMTVAIFILVTQSGELESNSPAFSYASDREINLTTFYK